jgi:hypothetical protein
MQAVRSIWKMKYSVSLVLSWIAAGLTGFAQAPTASAVRKDGLGSSRSGHYDTAAMG